MTYCSHCDTDPARSHGLCDACRMYVHRYSELPSIELLIRRQEQRDERRFRENAPQNVREMVTSPQSGVTTPHHR